jgi:hypothetical protein
MKYLDTPRQIGVFWTPDGESYMLHAEYLQKTLRFLRNRHFTCFGAVLYEGSMEEFEWKMPIFCARSQFLAGSSHTAANFSKSARD